MEPTKVHLKKNGTHATATTTTTSSSSSSNNKTTKLTLPKKDKANNTVCFVNAAVASENEVGLRKYSF